MISWELGIAVIVLLIGWVVYEFVSAPTVPDDYDAD